jgi:hypothetical protein
MSAAFTFDGQPYTVADRTVEVLDGVGPLSVKDKCDSWQNAWSLMRLELHHDLV